MRPNAPCGSWHTAPPQPPSALQRRSRSRCEFIRSEKADAAAILPGAERVGGKRVEFTAEDMPAAYRAFRSLVGLASI